MFRRVAFRRPLVLAPSLFSRRWYAVPGGQGPTAKPAAPDPVFMYSTKDNADPLNEPDPMYGRKRAKMYMWRIWNDSGLRLMLIFCIGGIGASFVFFEKVKNDMVNTKGLLGPKWKRHKSRLTVVFDLDECMVSYGDKAYRLQTALVQRPYLTDLLDYLSSIDAEVIVWSASSERYLRDALQQIDPLGTRISRTIARDTSWFTSDNYFEKNVLWLNRNLNDVIIIENRALSVRSCNYNALLVPDFIRGEYMETGQDYPANDVSFKHIKEILADLEGSGISVPLYLADRKRRHKAIQDIPCHLGIRQMPDELAKGTFMFVCDKFILEKAGRIEAIILDSGRHGAS